MNTIPISTIEEAVLAYYTQFETEQIKLPIPELTNCSCGRYRVFIRDKRNKLLGIYRIASKVFVNLTPNLIKKHSK